MGTIFEVRGERHSVSKLISYGARRTRLEAEELLKESRAQVVAAGGNVDRWWIEVVDSTGLFEIPPRPDRRTRLQLFRWRAVQCSHRPRALSMPVTTCFVKR